MWNTWCLSAIGAVLVAAAGVANAAPQSVEAFDAAAWQQLQRGSAPVAVVFTTTDCTHCPKVIERIAHEIRERRLNATLVAVVMDSHAPELLRNAHYRGVDRLLAFHGAPAPLRHAVDPRWRGVTPFVGLLAPGQAPALKPGMPSDGLLATWAQAGRGQP